MPFSELEKKVLEVFVTSAEDKIYAIKHNVTPEIFGAFGSYFSRDPKDFRVHLMDAIKGQIKDEETSYDEDNLKWLTAGEMREPYEAIKKGLAQSQRFFKRWYGKYSHKSIANTVWIPMVATNVSMLFAKEMAYDQLAFFIEQSTRYVEFDAHNYHKDENIMKSKHAQFYIETLNEMADNYHAFKKESIDYYKSQIPYEDWLKIQDEETLKKDDEGRLAKYNREINGKALDVARFLLPQAVRTNLAWILDARSTEFDIAAWKGHPLNEIADAALLIEKHAGLIAPSLLKYTEKNEYYAGKLNDYYGDLRLKMGNEFKKGVDVISFEEDALNKVVAHILKRHNTGGTFYDKYKYVEHKLRFDDKMNILRRVTENRKQHDEWVEMDEEFDLVKMCFEIRSDVGAIRDWRRHQKWDRSEALYTIDNGYHTPYMLEEMSENANRLFDETIKIAHRAEKKIRKQLPHQAQYVIPMAAMHAITMSSGLDQLQYMLQTRSTVEGNFSYRQDAFNIAEVACKIHPWLLGYNEYPKGKSFREAYMAAPLKGIIRLDFKETGLHQ